MAVFVGGFSWQIPLNLAFCILGIDLVLLAFEYIPFTYRVQTDSRRMVVRFIWAVVGMLFLVPLLVWLEQWAIVAWWRYAILSGAVLVAWLELRRRQRANEGEQQGLRFEQRAASDLRAAKTGVEFYIGYMSDSAKLSHTAALILQTVDHGCSYGFDIMDETGLPSGTVYPALRRMEKEGLIASQWEAEKKALAEQRPARKYYRVTRVGTQVLEQSQKRYPLLGKLSQKSRR